MGNNRQHHKPLLHFWALIAMALGCSAVSSAWAGEAAPANPSLSSRWMLMVGAAFSRSDAEVSSFVKGTGLGGRIDLSTLGVDENHTSPLLALRYRPDNHWRWEISYENLRLDGNRGATYQIKFGNISIPVGWNVATELSADLYSASVGYAFYRRPNVELGGMFGISIFDLSADIEGSLTIGNAVATQSAGISEIVPVPVLGLYGSYTFNERWSVEGNVQYMTGSYADYSGYLFVASAALNYWVMSNAALSLGYKHLDSRVKYDGGSTRDIYDLQFGGPFATLSVGF